MAMLRLYRDIPIPRCNNKPRYPWRGLEIGESFFLATEDEFKARKLANNILGQARAARTTIRLTSRCQTEHGKFGVRIWRTA